MQSVSFKKKPFLLSSSMNNFELFLVSLQKWYTLKSIYIKCAKILRSITGAADIYPAKCEKGDFEESWLSIDLVSPKPFLDWGLVGLAV